jgi:hypothetical protein
MFINIFDHDTFFCHAVLQKYCRKYRILAGQNGYAKFPDQNCSMDKGLRYGIANKI